MNDVPFCGRHFKVILLGNNGRVEGGNTYAVINCRTNSIILQQTLTICNQEARYCEDLANRMQY